MRLGVQTRTGLGLLVQTKEGDVSTCLSMPAIPRWPESGKRANDRALTRLCVVWGCGKGWSVGLGRGAFKGRDVGLDGVQEGLASAHVGGDGGLFG